MSTSSLGASTERVFRNHILAGLPSSDLGQLRTQLTRVTLTSGQVLQEPESPIHDVFFVEDGMVSLTAHTLDGGQVEIGLASRADFVGASAELNPAPVAVHRAVVQIPGSAYRMTRAAFQIALAQSPALRDRCLSQVEMLMIHSSQVAVCNPRHSLSKRLARWLLVAQERVVRDALPLTQGSLSIMLGVRRSGITVAARDLQASGLIRLRRGRVTILDNAGLAAASCGCHRIMQQMRDRISPRLF